MKKTEKAVEQKSKGTGTLIVSPSAWMVWEKCALSLQAVKSPLVLERDEYAKEGTRLHAIIADILRDPDYAVSADSDDTALIRFAVETVRQELNGNVNYAVESGLSVKIKNVQFSGTADVIATKDDLVTVMDHKMGWREVEAEGNNQLKLYAHIEAARNEKIKRWKGVIINARFNSVSYTGGEIDPNYLSNTATDLLARTAKKQFAAGNHCAYCQRLSTCAKIRAAIIKWTRPGAIDSITRTPEKLAEALRLAKPAEKLFETIKKEAQLFMDLGGALPGVTVEYTAGTRAWPRDMNRLDIAARIGVEIKNMIEETFKSPAQAEKVGADKDAINSIVVRPPRKGFKFI
ncbi:MAG: DUF2800 domain-containing protein [Candidatus Omnitrophica bacterium]|jgi:hypothetical protein|nr:DUF2800 domain-containing protein [Candidatus Omnitrophota bacterium]